MIERTPKPDHREASDSNAREITRHGKHRVILCRDGIQWIIQRRAGKSGIRAQWKALHYVTTRKALLRIWPCLEPASGALSPLHSLPERARLGKGGGDGA